MTFSEEFNGCWHPASADIYSSDVPLTLFYLFFLDGRIGVSVCLHGVQPVFFRIGYSMIIPGKVNCSIYYSWTSTCLLALLPCFIFGLPFFYICCQHCTSVLIFVWFHFLTERVLPECLDIYPTCQWHDDDS
jgi:hypothetical protein